MSDTNRLDFEAPLLSVRRRSPVGTETILTLKKPPKRSPLPFYKQDLNSGPVREKGVIPFAWEQKPGQRKGGDTPARPSVPPKPPPGGSGSSSSSVKRMGSKSEDGEKVEAINDVAILRPKARIRIPRFWAKIHDCFGSPLSRVKMASFPRITTMRFRSSDDCQNEITWESVYGYRLGNWDQSQWEERSKIRSESYWSDSQTQEGGSSPFRHSDTTGAMDFTDEDFEAVVDGPRTKQSDSGEDIQDNELMKRFSEAFDSKILCKEVIVKEVGMNESSDDSLGVNVGDEEKRNANLQLCLVPPKLPKSPTESWLSRAVSSKKKLHPQSLLAIQFQPRSQSFRDGNVRRSSMNFHSLRFTEVVGKPTSPKCAS